MIAHVVERAHRIEGIDEVVVAVPDLPEDDVLTATTSALGVRVVRGPADDVLQRYLLAAGAANADAVVRVTADCPLLSPTVSSTVVADFRRGDADYVSNTLERTFPRGLDTEVVSIAALRTAAREAVTAAEREHVTPFVWTRPRRFRLRSIRTTPDRSDLRLTVDVAEDLALVRAVYDALGPDQFDIEDVIALLDRRPELVALNAGISQKSAT